MTKKATAIQSVGRYVLALGDLPAGFEAMPAAQLRTMEKDLPAGSRAFGFAHEDGHIVMGVLMPYPTETGQRVFDASLPFLVQAVAASLGGEGDFQKLDAIDDVGESRTASTGVVQMGAISMRLDMAGLRRGGVGAFLFVMYLDGEQPAASVGDLARKLDARIKKGQAQ